MLDVTSQLDETEREVGQRRIAAGEARSVVMRRLYDAAVEDVWDACTTSERLRRWFLQVTGDLRPGGTFSIKDNAHGAILRCEAPRLLTLSWIYGDAPASEVELRLSPGDGGDGTLLELEHAMVGEGKPLAEGLMGVAVGWSPALAALDLHLRDELPHDLAERLEAGEAPPPEIMELAMRSFEVWTPIIKDATGADPSGVMGPPPPQS